MPILVKPPNMPNMRLSKSLSEDEIFVLVDFHTDKIKESIGHAIFDRLDIEVRCDRIAELVSILEQN